MMDKIKKELQNTLHRCADMGLFKYILLKACSVWTIEESRTVNTLRGIEADFKICPYCGLNFFEKDGED